MQPPAWLTAPQQGGPPSQHVGGGPGVPEPPRIASQPLASWLAGQPTAFLLPTAADASAAATTSAAAVASGFGTMGLSAFHAPAWQPAAQQQPLLLPVPRVDPGMGTSKRLRWSQALHSRFVEAVQHLGGAFQATPKRIQDIMAVPGLTLYHVKSHLQKYRTALSDTTHKCTASKKRRTAGASSSQGGVSSSGEEGEAEEPLQQQQQQQQEGSLEVRLGGGGGRGGRGLSRSHSSSKRPNIWTPQLPLPVAQLSQALHWQQATAQQQQQQLQQQAINEQQQATNKQQQQQRQQQQTPLAQQQRLCNDVQQQQQQQQFCNAGQQQQQQLVGCPQEDPGGDGGDVEDAAGLCMADLLDPGWDSDSELAAVSAELAAELDRSQSQDDLAAVVAAAPAGMPQQPAQQAAAAAFSVSQRTELPVAMPCHDSGAQGSGAGAAVAAAPLAAAAAALDQRQQAQQQVEKREEVWRGGGRDVMLQAALRLQIGMQRQLSSTIQAQRELQLQLETHSRYIEGLLRAEGVLPPLPAVGKAGSSKGERRAAGGGRSCGSSRPADGGSVRSPAQPGARQAPTLASPAASMPHPDCAGSTTPLPQLTPAAIPSPQAAAVAAARPLLQQQQQPVAPLLNPGDLELPRIDSWQMEQQQLEEQLHQQQQQCSQQQQQLQRQSSQQQQLLRQHSVQLEQAAAEAGAALPEAADPPAAVHGDTQLPAAASGGSERHVSMASTPAGTSMVPAGMCLPSQLPADALAPTRGRLADASHATGSGTSSATCGGSPGVAGAAAMAAAAGTAGPGWARLQQQQPQQSLQQLQEQQVEQQQQRWAVPGSPLGPAAAATASADADIWDSLMFSSGVMEQLMSGSF